MLEPGLSPRRFLQRYWQKEPLLLRGAVSSSFGLSGDVLAGLACEDDVESRLVLGSVEQGFRLEHGPFEAKRFRRLPRREWTLLVQDVDQHLPRVAALFEGVSFIPDWRVDDVMVSYAVPGGSVGPHVDAYDVFLVQLQGERRWQLSAQQDLELRSDAELKLLARFTPEVEHVLGPGDVLYLPPGLAHYGLAQSECLTASVGFRAPSQDELLADFLQEVATGASLERYGDPDR
ncbi:MAG: cupin domain-containing protein, partial [Polyangiaceae bacterium]